jgi:hypothetical protein
MKKVLRKIIITLLVAFLVTPLSAFAQAGPASRVPIQLDGEGAFGLIDVAREFGSNACDTAESISGQVAGVLSKGLSFLGDSTALVNQLQAQQKVVDTALECWKKVATSASLPSTETTLFRFEKNNAARDKSQRQAVEQIAALKIIKKQFDARIQVASQDFWKAVLVGLLLKQTDRITERLVNQMTEKFKINNYANYISAVADTVYLNDAIIRNVDNDKDRAIVRSIITNPIFKTKVHPVIQTSALEYVGFDGNAILYNDPNLPNKMVRLANKEAYISDYQSRMLSKVDEVILKARDAAAAEVAQGQGYKSTMNNCGPSLTAQKQKDLEYQAILKEIEDRNNLHEQIHASATSTEEEKKKIGEDVTKVTSKLSSLGSIALQICEGVNTPAQKFKDSIHDLIGTRIKNFSDYNENNLPFFQKLVVSIGDSLINKYIFGQNVSTGDLLSEALGSATTGIAGSIPPPSSFPPSTEGTSGTTAGNAPEPTAPLLSYTTATTYSEQDPTPRLIFSIVVNARNQAGATRFVLTGPNVGGSGENRVEKTGSDLYGTYNAVAPSGSTFTVTVYGATGGVLRTASITVNEDQESGQVAGDFTGPVFTPRGPAAIIR